MDRDVVYGRVIWILNNHEARQAILQDQLDQERLALQEDLDRIYGAVGIKALDYSDTKVMSSIKDDARIATAIALAEERRNRYAMRVEGIKIELATIDAVYQLVCSMDGSDSSVLLALYYPKQTYVQAARTLGYSVQSITRRRSRAISHLLDYIVEANES